MEELSLALWLAARTRIVDGLLCAYSMSGTLVHFRKGFIGCIHPMPPAIMATDATLGPWERSFLAHPKLSLP